MGISRLYSISSSVKSIYSLFRCRPLVFEQIISNYDISNSLYSGIFPKKEHRLIYRGGKSGCHLTSGVKCCETIVLYPLWVAWQVAVMLLNAKFFSFNTKNRCSLNLLKITGYRFMTGLNIVKLKIVKIQSKVYFIWPINELINNWKVFWRLFYNFLPLFTVHCHIKTLGWVNQWVLNLHVLNQ